MYEEERVACRAAAERIEREFDMRTTRLWPRAWLLLPLATSWPPTPTSGWARYAFALGPTRSSVRRGVEHEHALVSRAWGVARHEGSLRAAPSFELFTDEIAPDGDADLAPALDTSEPTPSVGALVCALSNGPLTPSAERRLAGAYLANFDRVAFSLPRAALVAHRDMLAWLDRWRAEKALWVSHDPSDLFADPIADRIAAADAKEKKVQAEIDTELAALKAKLTQ